MSYVLCYRIYCRTVHTLLQKGRKDSMSTKQKFGGPWTIEKLNILSNYLDFYSTALKSQPFQLIYIDAFAGTGRIKIGDEEKYEEIDGSARLALQSSGRFAEYIFIEKKKAFVQELEQMVRQEFPDKANRVRILDKDCNEILADICQKVDWRSNRAILFIDPYAADVKWETLQTVANTKAIDVWYLFPFSAATRMMKKSGEIDPSWVTKLNSIFGDNSWEKRFYQDDLQTNFWGETGRIRELDSKALKSYIEERLGSIFPKVSPHSRILYNRKNSPLFLFCFAVSNDSPKAIGLALRAANYILKDQKPS